MTNPDKDLLTTTEGVDEGSAASAAEGPKAEGDQAGGGQAGQAESTGLGSATDGTDADRPGHAHGDAESQPAPPSEVDSAESRQARESGTGQQLAAGEG